MDVAGGEPAEEQQGGETAQLLAEEFQWLEQAMGETEQGPAGDEAALGDHHHPHCHTHQHNNLTRSTYTHPTGTTSRDTGGTKRRRVGQQPPANPMP